MSFLQHFSDVLDKPRQTIYNGYSVIDEVIK